MLERVCRPRTAAGLGLSAIVVLTVLAYVPAMRGGFVWDDDDYVTRNSTLRDTAGLRRIWLEIGATPQYYPLVHTSFWVEHRLWGVNPFGYHVTNVLLHALSAVLLWRLLLRLEVPGAWLAAAIFAVHPVHVESVAWITERKNVLSGFFYLGAMTAFLWAVRPGEPVRRWFYALALILFVCALLSKTVVCTLPAALLLALWWRDGRINWRSLVWLIPMFVLGAAMGLLTGWMERHRVGASGPEWDLSFIDRCLIAGRAVWFYAGKLIWPNSLTFIYPRWDIAPTAAWQWIYPLAGVATIVVLWLLRRRIGKAPLAAVLFFVVTLGPALGFVSYYPMRYSFVADHFQYLASIGLIALSVAAGAIGLRRIAPSRALTRSLAGAGLLIGLGMLTWKQGWAYRDEETLWRDTIAKNPGCWMARCNLGSILLESGKTGEAITQLDEALRLRPDDYQIRNNLASALDREGRLAEAVHHYDVAIRIQPNDHRVHTNLAIALARQGQASEAIRHLEIAARLQPSVAESRYHLAALLADIGRYDEAIEHYRSVLELRPGWLVPMNNLAWLLVTRPGPGPDDAAEAIRLAKQACGVTAYKDPGLLDTLAAAFAAGGQYTMAVATAELAIGQASSARLDKLADDIRGRRDLYKAGRHYTQQRAKG